MSYLVICSKNRSEDLFQLFESLKYCRGLPEKVLLVDSSDEANFSRVLEVVKGSRQFLKIDIERFLGTGLVLARNFALELLESRHQITPTDIVHFVDDDVTFSPDYFLEIEHAIEEQKLAGACGRTLMPSFPTIPPGNFGRHGCGRLSKFGIASPQWQFSSPGLVQWLPGCSMSYRMDQIQGMRFDVKRQLLPAGEDIEFSSRVFESRGPLGYVPTALMWHRMSERNRPVPIRWAYEDVHHRKDLGEKRILNCSPISVFLGSLFIATSHFLRGINPRAKDARQRLRGTLLGLFDFYVRKKSL